MEPVAIISNQYPKVVIPLLNSADESIDIIVYDWRFYENQPSNPVSLLNTALSNAVKRGVKVRCLVSSDVVVDNLKKIGCLARRLHSEKMLHTKMLLIDQKKIIIGSHNFTQNAFSRNEEASIFCEMLSIDNDFVKYFNNLYGV